MTSGGTRRARVAARSGPRIEVEIGTLVVDDPALARHGELAAALEHELARTLTWPAVRASEGRSVREVATTVGHDGSARSLGAAIGHAVGRELAE